MMNSLKIIVLISATALLSACGSKSEKKEEEPQKKVQKDTVAQKPKEKEPKYDLWTSKDIDKKLMKFAKEHPNTKAIIKTNMGDIEVKLYEDVPMHRANFVRLALMEFFDSTLFFRVERQFMIQGGMTDKADNYERELKLLKAGRYRVPSEINEKYPHVTGAIAMANNSYLAKEDEERNYSSDPYNFYIVDGRNKITESFLKKTEAKYGVDISPENRKKYIKYGGAPHLDMQYTVFGHVTKGMNIVNKIAALPTDKDDRPEKDVHIIAVEIL